MENFEHFQVISEEHLQDINGGSFAYDLGRIIRFYLQMPNVAYALSDWYVTDAVNEIINE